VSRATASRVINGSAQVTPETRAAVEQAVARLGYCDLHDVGVSRVQNDSADMMTFGETAMFPCRPMIRTSVKS
jgi:hypothetical protein